MKSGVKLELGAFAAPKTLLVSTLSKQARKSVILILISRLTTVLFCFRSIASHCMVMNMNNLSHGCIICIVYL